MSEHEYPIPVRKVVKTLTELCRHQNKSELVVILENAHPRFEEIEYDNWNGGTYTYRLRLDLPVPIFAEYQPNIESLEKELLSRITSIDRRHSNDSIGELMITPSDDDSTVYGNKFAPSQAETRHLWKDGHFRLFLSHLAEHKIKVHELKSALVQYNIDAFVAHNDIQPSREWQNEIELALNSMDSLAALVTPNFKESSWCDQEVGWALGKGVPVLPIRLGCDPYGFAGKFQGISGTLDNPDSLARSILDALRNKPETKRVITRSLVQAFCTSPDYPRSLVLAPLIAEYQEHTDDEKMILWKACEENEQVRGAWGVTKRIYDAIGKPPPVEVEEEETPF